jgi:hypothetical protein
MYSDPPPRRDDGGTGSTSGRFDTGGSSATTTEHPAEAVKHAVSYLGELKEYAGYYVSAKLDSYKSSAVNLGIYAVLGLLGAVVGAAMLATAAVLLLWGLAEGLGALAVHLFGGGWHWLGPFLVGLILLGGMAAGVIFGLKWFTRTSHSRLVAKYEDRKRRERIEYGFDVEQRAREERAAEARQS